MVRTFLSLWLAAAVIAEAAIETSIPISADTGTSIARELFPVAVKLPTGNLYLTDPSLLFLDKQRVGMQIRFQAYDNRPLEGIAISEMGRAVISGKIGYDPSTRQILLHDPHIDKFEFDRQSAVTQRLSTELNAGWSVQITNPIRSDLPPHPFLLPFVGNIKNIFYDGKSINLALMF